MNVTVTQRYHVRGLDLIIGKTSTEPYVLRFEWPGNETPWTTTIEDACSYTAAAPIKVTAKQVHGTIKRQRAKVRKAARNS